MSYEAVVFSLGEKLGDILIEEAPLLSNGVRETLEWIRRELKSMQFSLKDAESKRKEDARVGNWVAQFRDVCYEAEDVIDTFILSQRAKKRDGFARRVKRSMLLGERRTRYKLGQQIQKIKLNIGDIKMKRAGYGIRDISEGRQEASSSSQSFQGRRRLFALREEAEVVGQREGINTVKEQLMSDDSRRCVISIIGMGGLGKTTLAKKVYHDVKHDFDCHAFVSLSEQFGIKDVLMRILRCIMDLSREEGEKLNEDELGRKLHDQLREKRYLLVIDDMWSTQAWDKLNSILPNVMNKSRVMLTTRIKDVALYADPSSHPHEMRLLIHDEGWELFMKKIFREGDPPTACPKGLEETGRRILERCGGLPLAILVVGGLLSRRDATSVEWSIFLERVKDLSVSFKEIWKILALSYWDLPFYLKPCFLYLSLFPEDSEINSGRIIRLWIAEGFIEQRGNRIMEDVAEGYLEELVDRSMIQVASRKSDGSVWKCRLHNLLRDLSISEARQNNFLAIPSDNDTCSSSISVRRLALYHTVDWCETINGLRSLFCFPGSEVPLSQLLNIGGKLLKVLVAEGAEFTNEQSFEEVGACVYLRYLELARMIDVSLPSSIGNLSHLQTLKLSFHGTLPNAIWNLEQLRHLSCSGFNTDEHPKLKKLRNLQTLKLSAGSWIGDGLGKLSNLRKLGICGDLSSHHKALSDSIEKLSNLRSLKLRDGHKIPVLKSFTHHLHLYKMYLDGITEELPVLPPNLAELTLKNSLLRQDAICTLGKLPHLKILSLLHKSYDGEEVTCSQGGFPRLELLKLCELPLKCLDVMEGAMISLKSVELFRMSKLETDTLPKRVHSILKQI